MQPKKKGKSVTPAGSLAVPLPSLIPASLATLVKSVPTGDDWLHEIKYDGYRILCRIEKGKARLFSRNGKDWTSRMPIVAQEAEKLGIKTAWLDGEVCAVDSKGR